MNERKSADASLFDARLEDMAEKAERGEIALSVFLSPAERAAAERFLVRRGLREQAVFWGGYPAAERVRLYLLPDYCREIPGMMPEEGSDPALTLDDREVRDAVTAIRISGSGYRTLAHRDWLGSLLGLGLERDAVGDIAVQNAHEAVVFCPAPIRNFLLENLKQAANDPVRCRIYLPDGDFTDGRRTVPVSDTVASARLDCVVASLANLSREAAQERIRSGLVEVDYEPAERVDQPLQPPLTLTVRGVGKFRLLPFGGETRKGRLRLQAEKYV